jgi:hypothetical protein
VDAAAACEGLDLATCRRTAGCAADECPSCVCDVNYRGCLPAGQQPADCPALGCPSADCCREQSQCTGGICASPGETVCGGACNGEKSTCTDDSDCRPMAAQGGVGAVLVCDPIPCSCGNGAHHCVPGCATNEDCGEGATCTAATGRCAPSTCSAEAPCPLDFDCTFGICARRTCTDDLTCDHYCVEGVCQGSLGECVPAVP